jgi:hypothetical protein
MDFEKNGPDLMGRYLDRMDAEPVFYVVDRPAYDGLIESGYKNLRCIHQRSREFYSL